MAHRYYDRPDINPDQKSYKLELIPNQLILTLYKLGSGRTVQQGQFVTIRQRIRLQSGKVLMEGRKTYISGRQKLIQGLQLGISMFKQEMKGTLYISPQYAYQNQQLQGVPKNSPILVDFQVVKIEQIPSYSNNQINDVFQEIVYLSKKTDKLVKNYELNKAFKTYCTIMKLLLNKNADLSKKNQRFIMAVHIKAIEVALLTQNYYDVILWSFHYLIYPEKENDTRCLMARARAYRQVEEFNLALEDLQKIVKTNPFYEPVKSEINKVKQMKALYDLEKDQTVVIN